MGRKSCVKLIKGEKTIQEMTPGELAYFAGIIDGCGTLEINRRLEPQLRIEKKSDLAKTLALKIGGYLRYRKPDKSANYHRYALAIRGKMLEVLLIKIRPLLRTNKRKIGLPLLLEAFDAEDEERLKSIRKQLSKKRWIETLRNWQN